MKYWTLLIFLLPTSGLAVEYTCNVERKIDGERVYSADQLKNGKFSVKITETNAKTFLSRCSYSAGAGAVTCDEYEVDKTVFDENVKIKKYYVFRSHFDVQIFSNLSFVENNGRGTIAYGKCAVVSP